MKCVQFVTASLDYSGFARQLTILAARLPRTRVRVAVLGGSSPWSNELRVSGVEVETCGRRRPFDLWPYVALHRLLRSCGADVVHVWGASALKAVALMERRRELWVSAALPPLGEAGRVDTWLLRRADRVVAFSTTEAGRYRTAGVAQGRITVVRPAAFLADADHQQKSDENAVVVLGPLLPHKGVREAVWAMDILHNLYPKLDLVMVSDPPPPRLLAGLPPTQRVHFVGRHLNVMPYLHRAKVMWVPGRAGGVAATLEAMAAGKPVIAGWSPELAEVIEDGVTGSFFRAGDKADLARQTRRLLDDPDRRRMLGEAGRRQVAERFAPEQLIDRYLGLLEEA